DHQRTALVAAQNARRERPDGLQVLYVFSRDLFQFAIPGGRVVAVRHYPVLGVLLHFQQFFIRRCDHWQRYQQPHGEGTLCNERYPHPALLPISTDMQPVAHAKASGGHDPGADVKISFAGQHLRMTRGGWHAASSQATIVRRDTSLCPSPSLWGDTL